MLTFRMLLTFARRSTLTPVSRKIPERVSPGPTTHFDTHPLAPTVGAGVLGGVVVGAVGEAEGLGLWLPPSPDVGIEDELAEPEGVADGVGTPEVEAEDVGDEEAEAEGVAELVGEVLAPEVEVLEGEAEPEGPAVEGADVVCPGIGVELTPGWGARLWPKPVRAAAPIVPRPTTPKQTHPAVIIPIAPRPSDLSGRRPPGGVPSA